MSSDGTVIIIIIINIWPIELCRYGPQIGSAARFNLFKYLCTGTITPRYNLDVQVQCCFTSTETIRTIRDGGPRTATSTFSDTAPEL